MTNSVFECANPKCGETLATEGLNNIQLQVLRRWAKTCPRCQQRTKWQEKLPLLNTEQQKSQSIGGSKNAKGIKRTKKSSKANGSAGAPTDWVH